MATAGEQQRLRRSRKPSWSPSRHWEPITHNWSSQPNAYVRVHKGGRVRAGGPTYILPVCRTQARGSASLTLKYRLWYGLLDDVPMSLPSLS